MKKNLKRNKKGQFVRSNSEYSFVNLSTYTSPEIVEVNNRDWVDYGADNNYFQFLIDRYNGSPTNNAAINGISQAIYGKGLNATDSNRKPNEYAQMISLFKKDVVRKLCYDLKLMGQCSVQVIYDKNRKKIAKLEHIPVETLRAAKANEDGDIPAYYYFKDWSKLKPNDVPRRIPAYGMSNENIEIYYIKPYKAGFYYYAPVDYQGGLQYAELEEEISNYHLNNIMNGLAPSMLINFNNGTPNQEERQLLEQKIAQKFSGTSNAGKFILAFNDNKEASADITPVQLSDAHQQYQFLSEESTKKIMVAHRIVSPMLLGIKDQSGLGNNAEEIKTASLLMDNTVIRPFQELLIDGFDHLLAHNDIALKLYFTTLQPLEFTEVDSMVQDKEDIEEETGYEFKVHLKKIDGKEAYETIEEAEKKAEEMGCSGYHEHEVEGVMYYMPCQNHEELKAPCWDGYEQIGSKMKNGKKVPNCVPLATELCEQDVKSVVGSLATSGKNIDDEYEFAAVLKDDNINAEDYAGYLLEEKKSTLSKIKDFVGLKSASEDNVGSVKDGSAFSYLDPKNGRYKIRYRYARGMSKSGESRAFCKEMMRLSGTRKSGLVWRIEDIDKASNFESVNVEFRHKPNIRYDIFKLKGGIYCQHVWERVLFRLKKGKYESSNIDNYKRTGSIPSSYIKNPRGTRESEIATDKLPGRGAYPKN
tara:strand:- start:2493 stop:4592 length:2100 start_codon:yes stop_codon:yes gene_type:complete